MTEVEGRLRLSLALMPGSAMHHELASATVVRQCASAMLSMQSVLRRCWDDCLTWVMMMVVVMVAGCSDPLVVQC